MKKTKVVVFDIEQMPLPEYMFNSYAGFKVDKSLLLSCQFYDCNTNKAWSHYLSKQALKEFVACNKIEDKEERLAMRLQKDLELVELTLDVLSSYDVIVTWYGARHDYKYINGKAAMHRLPFLLYQKHVDLYDTCKHKFSFSSNRLGSAARILGVKAKGEICHSKWSAAREGDYKALQEISDYGINDVETTYEVMEAVKPLIKTLPHILSLETSLSRKDRIINHCKWCGSSNIIKRGSYINMNGTVSPRVSCNDCQPRVK